MAGVQATARWLWRRVGRRGVSLLFVGLLAAVLTVSLLLTGPQQVTQPAFQALADVAPLGLWAACWGISGALCWVQAFVSQDRIAFAVATAMWWSYGLAYIIGALSGVNPRGWVGGLLWMGFGGWLNLIATWPEAHDVGPVRGRHAYRD